MRHIGECIGTISLLHPKAESLMTILCGKDQSMCNGSPNGSKATKHGEDAMIDVELNSEVYRKRRQVGLDVIIIILAAFLMYKYSPNSKLEITTELDENVTDIRNTTLCESAGCKRVADAILYSLNTSMDPCQDFHEFACGGHKTMERRGNSKRDVYSTVYKQTEDKYRLSFETAQFGPSRASRIASNLFLKCTAAEKTSYKIHTFGYGSNFNNTSLEEFLHAMMMEGVPSLFKVEPKTHSRNNIIVIDLSVTDRNADGEMRSELYSLHDKVQAKVIYQFAKKLKSISSRNIYYSYMSVEELNRLTKYIDWNVVFDGFVNEKSIISLGGSVSWLSGLSDLVHNTNSSVTMNYCRYQIIRSSRRFLYTTGENKMRNPDDECFHMVADLMPATTAAIFEAEFLAKVERIAVQKIVHNVRSGVITIMENQQWLGKYARLSSVDKVKATKVSIGYPYNEFDLEAQDRFWKEATFLTEPLSSLEFHREIKRFIAKKSLENIGQPSTFDCTPDMNTVNAYFCSFVNKIYLTAPYLQSPLFELDGPIFYQYGVVGSVVGHEFMHAFDSEGYKIDKNGYYGISWSRYDVVAFKERTECMVDQYSEYFVQHAVKPVNGSLTINENIADNGGVAASFLAYKRELKLRPTREILPGLGHYSDDQLFYISYAQKTCETTSRYTVSDALKDVHSPYEARLRGVVSNSKDFSKAFNCPIGSQMNPVKKCHVWSGSQTSFPAVHVILLLSFLVIL